MHWCLLALALVGCKNPEVCKTIDAVDCDLVLIGTPIDLARVVKIERPNLRVTYDLVEQGDAFAEAVERAARSRMAAS